MEKIEHFKKLKLFLEKYKFFHELEMMEHYPYDDSPFYSFGEELLSLDDESLLSLYNTYDTKKIKNEEFINFLSAIKDLSFLPAIEVRDEPLPKELKHKLKDKKEHEIKKLIGKLKDIPFHHHFDIGGGIGHFPLGLRLHGNHSTECFDMDEKLQITGKEKSKKLNLTEVNFIKQKITSEKDIPLPKDKTLLSGLHACGNLSSFIIKAYKEKPYSYLASVGCCYHKLEGDYNLSSLAKMNPLIFTKHALTVAAKSNSPLDLETLNLKRKIKRYRYALHFYIKTNFDISFLEIGNTKLEDYDDSFSLYVKKYAKNYFREDAEEFFNRNDIQEKINLAISMGLLRELTGRLVEIYIVLDRALYLEENYLRVEMGTLFDREKSPRNILLFSRRDEKLPSSLHKDFPS